MPNIKSLVRRQDGEGLLKAASYKDLAPSSVGTVRDGGIPVRADAVLALGMLAPEAGLPATRAGLGDPADQVRCAAVRVLHAFNEVSVLAQSQRRSSRRAEPLPGAGSRSARRFSPAVGYALQTLFDHVSVPAHVAELVFFGVFEWDGVLALIAGIIAVWTGWSRNDWTVWLGLVAISYVVLAQTAQSLWD
jgi:hypothetical protein